ncbi:MAG: hypothetical protein ACE5JG_11050, partial [Planctomycetota bacterium]
GTSVTAAGFIRPGALDGAGLGSLSLPVAPDAATAFLVTIGGDGVAGTGDDPLGRVSLPTGLSLGSLAAPAAFALRRPVAVSFTQAVVPTGGPDGTAGTADDTLDLFTLDAGGGFTATPKSVPGLDAAALEVAAPVGTRGVVLATLGPDLVAGTGDEALQLFADVNDASPTSVAVPGRAVLTAVGSGAVVVHGPGFDLVPGGGDDEVRVVTASGTSGLLQAAPFWRQTLLPAADGTRSFAVGPGPDLAFGTGDEEIVVHSILALGSQRDGTALPAAQGGLGVVRAGSPFVPVGPSCGLVQSPGPDLLPGTFDDALVLARY